MAFWKQGFGGAMAGVHTAARDGELTALRARFAALSRSQATIEFALDGTILGANDNFLSVLGYRLEDVKGRHHSLFVDAQTRASAQYRQFWDKLAS